MNARWGVREAVLLFGPLAVLVGLALAGAAFAAAEEALRRAVKR